MRRPRTPGVLLLIAVVTMAAALALSTLGGGTYSLTGASVVPDTSGQKVPDTTSLSVHDTEDEQEGSGGGETYVWTYGGREWSYGLNVSPAVQGYYSNRTRPVTGEYSVYVTDPVDDEVLDSLASSFRKRSELEGFSQQETVEFVTAFVQNLRYTPDNVSTSMDEYPRYPVETLVENGGDCEDTAILLSAVLDRMGYDVVLLELPSHMAVGVAGNWTGNGGHVVEHRGREYRYVETTGSGWRVGEIPEQFLDDPITVRSLEPTPVLKHSWDAVLTEGSIDISVVIENVGSAPAEGTRVRYSFEMSGENEVAEISGPVVVEADEMETFRTTLSPPPGTETRLVVEVLNDGVVVDESRSERFTL